MRGQEVAVAVDESKAVYMELAAGEMSLHHVLLFHASDVNTSDQRRVGIAIRYLPTRVKALPGLPKDYVTLVRGTYNYHNFHLETAPVHESDPATLEQDPSVLRRIVWEFFGTVALDCWVEVPGEVTVGNRVELRTTVDA